MTKTRIDLFYDSPFMKNGMNINESSGMIITIENIIPMNRYSPFLFVFTGTLFSLSTKVLLKNDVSPQDLHA